jgi:hypothetical protein
MLSPVSSLMRAQTAFNIGAYYPFNIGHHACIGKSLALQELRYGIACVVLQFNMRLAPGFDVDKFMRDSMLDMFFASCVACKSTASGSLLPDLSIRSQSSWSAARTRRSPSARTTDPEGHSPLLVTKCIHNESEKSGSNPICNSACCSVASVQKSHGKPMVEPVEFCQKKSSICCDDASPSATVLGDGIGNNGGSKGRPRMSFMS